MKIALCHDYLIQYGGAERVLEVLCAMFPDAPIYTLLYDKEKMHGKFADRKIITSFLDFSFVRRHYVWFILLMPLAATVLKISREHDLVICDSASFAKGIRVSVGAKSILYCYTPLRYAWDNSILNSGLASIGMSRILRFFSWPILRLLQLLLRIWDRHVSSRFVKIFAVSNFIAKKIERNYGLVASVLYPPVDLKKFYYDQSVKRENFFLMVGRLVSHKKFDLVIKTFNELGLPLKIVGIGPEGARLRKLAQLPLIEFIGKASDEELRKYYARARALIFPQEEDFGISAVEAIACGAPVIAYGSGGILEIVKNNVNGLFFNDQSMPSLKLAIDKFLTYKWKYEEISKTVEKFSTENFKMGISRIVDEVNMLK